MTHTDRHDEASRSAGTGASTESGAPRDSDAPQGNGSSQGNGTPEDARSVSSSTPSVQLPPTPPPPRPRTEGEPVYETGGLRLALLVGAFVALGVFAGWVYAGIVLGVVIMIFLHELGHFATAKWSGMKVTEFFIGFGPRIWSFQRGETEYGLKLVPAGAYVRIIGMNNLDEADAADEPRTYRQQSFPKRLLVVSAGSIMHFVQAFVLLVLALGVVGIPGGSITDPQGDPTEWGITSVTEDSAAEAAGLTADDAILTVDGAPAAEFGSFSDAIAAYDVGDTVTFEIERNGEVRTVPIELGARPEEIEGEPGSVFLGVSTAAALPDDPIGIGTAITRAPGEMVSFMGTSVGALAGFFSPDGLGDYAENVSRANEEPATTAGGSSSAASSDDGSENRMLSIFGAVRLAGQGAEIGGLAFLLFFFFQINVFIGIFNMVPVPPLDGGHAAFAIYERVRSRKGKRYHADMTKLLPVAYVAVMGLVVLGVTSLYLDIVNPIDL
ncbi:MAG TPA: site-2 protease family protein [Acidimicrobiales bacterium]|nr:site-2 protease family protein [Acidimicrobiales bacterium]